MQPEILYEDKDVLAINKPSGLVVHLSSRAKAHYGASSDEEHTLVDWIMSKYPEIKEVGEPGKTPTGQIIYRPGIVHRLDRETSGVMLVAKNQKSFENLKEQFQKHEIEKTYHAFVNGEIKNEEGVIDRPIGRSSKDFRMWSAQRGARGEMREAVTNYKVISRKKINAQGYSFIEVRPKTGRTHQIRVHFKAIHHPLVADSLYAPSTENSLGFKRLALHSYIVTFKDTKDKSHTVTAPYPEDFEKAIKIFNF